MKKILGLDLGTTSIGFAQVIEGAEREDSKIELMGVRVNPLTTDEQTNFEKGKPISINADRTLKRGMRRNLDRYQLRRENLIEILTKSKIIDKQTILAEHGPESTHSTYKLRARAAEGQIPLDAFARVLLAINKKRGYKSSRKTRNEEEGQAIDAMLVAKRLYEFNLTPGELAHQLLNEGKKRLPDFYRSDLQSEFDKVWKIQQDCHPDIFTEDFKKNVQGKGQRATSALFWTRYGFNTAENKGNREEKRLRAYEWRSSAASLGLEKEQAAYVITEINNDLNKSSGYLGAISDRSKELYFNGQTVGQYLYKQIQQDFHKPLKGQVFYRQDYLDEFERIWEVQAQFYSQLTSSLKMKSAMLSYFIKEACGVRKDLLVSVSLRIKKSQLTKTGKK